MKKNNILPTIDLQNSREYSGAYNSRDFYKGTSFKMAGEWITNTHYFNDEYIVDFVSFEGALLSCIRSHTSSSLNMPELVRENDKIIGIKPNLFWAFVMAGVEGPVGKVWVPEVKNGIISWKESNTSPSSTPIENLKGEPGDTPIVGIKKDTLNNTYYWTVSINGESPRWILDENGQKISAQGLKGDPGKNGTDGKPGKNGADGITPEFKIENDYWFISYNNGTNWTQLGKAKGDRGATGEKGKDAIQPKFRISLGNWEVSYDKGINWEKVGRATGSKGDPGKDGVDGRAGKDGKDGITPEFKIVNNNWYITYDEGISWKLLGRAIGDQGEPGKTPALVRKFGDPDNLTDDRILWGYLGDPTSEWVTLCYLEELRGDSIKSVNISDAEGHLELTMESSKVITSTGSVLPRFNAGTIETVEWDQNPSLVIDKTNAPREWALNVKVPKGKPATVTVVSEVEKLAPDAQPYVTDLNPDISDANLKFGIPQGEKGDPGDENIAIGCQSDFPNNEPEHDKIWYDPCDEAMDQYSVQDFLYHSYIAVGGTLNQEQFEAAWKSFPNTAGFEIKFANSFEKLGDPTADKLGKLYMIPAQSTVLHDLFEEYIVVHSPSTTEEVYMWEKWGSGQITVDLSNYYTKTEVDRQIQNLEDKIEKVDSLSTTYNSNMPDDLQVTDNHGGIKKGVTAGELKTKTWAQLMDDILFPTVQPTVNAPSASVALSNGFSNNGVYEIGAAAPAAGTSVKGSFNRGTVTVVGQPNKNRAGALIEDESYVATGAGSQELPEKIVLGAMTYKYHAAYGEGDELVDSKGNKATVTPNPLSAGSIDSSNVTVYGTYPYFSNGVMASTSSNELSSLPASFVDNAKFRSLIRIDDNTQIAAKFASEAEHSTKARLYVPATKKVTAVKAMNALTDKFDVDFTAWEMLADTVNQTVQGTEVAYKVWTTTGGLQGGNQYLFTIANA